MVFDFEIDIHVPSDDGTLPLHYALIESHTSIALFFLEEYRKQGRLEEALNRADTLLPIHGMREGPDPGSGLHVGRR